MRDSFIFYKSFYESIKELDPKDQVQIYNAIFEYEFYKIEPELSGVCKSIFTLIIPQLEANNKRYENGKKGGRPKTKEKPNNNQNETKTKPNVNDNDNVNDNVNENDKLIDINLFNKNNFTLKNIFDKNFQCEETTKLNERCNRKASYEINGKYYCNQHARSIIPDINQNIDIPNWLDELEDYN